jgi:hypothetical protein
LSVLETWHVAGPFLIADSVISWFPQHSPRQVQSGRKGDARSSDGGPANIHSGRSPQDEAIQLRGEEETASFESREPLIHKPPYVEFPIVERLATMREPSRICEFLQARLTGPPNSSGAALHQELNADLSSEFERHLSSCLFDCSARFGDASNCHELRCSASQLSICRSSSEILCVFPIRKADISERLSGYRSGRRRNCDELTNPSPSNLRFFWRQNSS